MMIRASDLWKIYDDGKQKLEILKGINVEIIRGEFVAVVGKSGSGKTTLLSLLAGLDRPTSGQVEFNGQRIDQWTEEEMIPLRRKHIGFIFQAYHLVPTLTALENVAIPAQLAGIKRSEEAAADLLKRVGLLDRLDHRPHQLSGGEQQRVSICRALVNDPDVLFADEPTGNLDVEHGDQVMDLLLALRGKRTLILVTHDLALADRADRKIPIVGGLIADVGTRQNKLA
jgi:putative ABC transport system ATP-binding protein